MKSLHIIVFLLLIIGGLNWLLVGLLGWDISRWLGGMDSGISRLIYVLVGLSAVIEILTHGKGCKVCGKGNSGMNM